jgi:hypothetical protein
MNDALIGFSGFVGSTLLKQKKFVNLFRSTNILDIEKKEFDIVVCAGTAAQKWIANSDPVSDRSKILSLIKSLKTIKCKKFVLISTVDVFKFPVQVDESTCVDEHELMPYGLHRHELEKFVKLNFNDHLIVRLPGLVGPGLRKNAIFDLHNNNNIDAIDSRSIYQFYPMVNLWYDINIAINSNLKLIHLTSEPLSIAELSEGCFGRKFNNHILKMPHNYDFQSRHAEIFGSSLKYQYSKRDTILSIRSYAQSECFTNNYIDSFK